MTSVGVVVLDTLRKDRFDEHFGWLTGRRFDNAWSTSHWTVPAHASMFTGLYPVEHGSHAKTERIRYEGKVLSERLREAGYTTKGFSSNPYVSPQFDFDRGFTSFTGSYRVRGLFDDIYNWWEFVSEHDHDGPTRYLHAVLDCLRSDCNTAKSLEHGLLEKLEAAELWEPTDSGAEEALEWARGLEPDENEFVFLNLMEAHAPYDEIPAAYDVDASLPDTFGLELLFDPPDETEVRRAYDAAVRYLSDVYRDVFDVLSRKLDYVVTLSDHGEMLGEHSLWGHLYGLYPELTHVPLVVSGRGVDDERRDEVVNLLDVHRTVLDVADVEAPSRGRSLLGEVTDRTCLFQSQGIIPHKLEDKRQKGYDIDAYDHPLNGVACEDGVGFETSAGWVPSGLRNRMEDVLETLERRDYRDDRDVSERTRKQLGYLGYS